MEHAQELFEALRLFIHSHYKKETGPENLAINVQNIRVRNARVFRSPDGFYYAGVESNNPIYVWLDKGLESMEELYTKMGITLGLSPDSNLDHMSFMALWTTNIIMAFIGMGAMLIMFLPPYQRVRYVRQWLMLKMEEVAHKNELFILKTRLQ